MRCIFGWMILLLASCWMAAEGRTDDCAQAKSLLEQARDNAGEAEALCRQAIRLCPKFPEAHARLAAILEARGKLPDAINSMGRAKELDPGNPEYARELERLQDASTRAITEKLAEQPAVRTRGLTRTVDVVSGPKLDLPVLFKFDSFQLTGVARYNLDALAAAFKDPRLQNEHFLIRGHTDNVGRADYNRSLSKRRAASVKEYLVQNHGISSLRLEVEGVGMAEPVASNDTEEGRQANRRVEIRKLSRE